MEQKGRPVGDADMEGTLDAPTVMVNRFIVSTSQIGFRIAFGESRSFDTPVHARINIFLEPVQAYELKQVLDELLKPFLPDIEGATSAEQPVKPNGDEVS